MINILTNLTAIAAAVTPVFISNGNQVLDTANALCNPSQPMQIFAEGNPAAQLYNLVQVDPNIPTEFQIQSNHCAGFSVSYPGETTGAGPLRAQAVIQPDSGVFFTISPAINGGAGPPFNIIYESANSGPLYLTGWEPDLTFSTTGPLTFEHKNADDLRQQWDFVDERWKVLILNLRNRQLRGNPILPPEVWSENPGHNDFSVRDAQVGVPIQLLGVAGEA
ncbi:hypothetical protein BDP27DRAFT_1366924 [Rhodocollybia butyracea]|uniref:Uncharacterized protein n=1 Tax=Rhodocollybia butyracea TaxID=206335 RepID=A0A9P5U3R5_9AGAR|nr:hypothetical protein BDP27DRAFT_1366924 [Rhodocollybia butyracea]